MTTATPWARWVDARAALTCSYPASVDGHPVALEEEQATTSTTWRFTSNDRQDVYFEITIFGQTTVQEHYAALRTHSTQQPELTIGAPETTTRDGYPTIMFWLHRGPLTRQVLLVQYHQDVYRITYNPRHPTNQQILETVRFT